MKTKICLFCVSVVTCFIVAAITGCNQHGRGIAPKADAVAIVMATKGNAVSGVVTFSKVKDGVRVIADLKGLSPGLHGIHIHEFGDCRADDGSSAGGHFNPHAKAHGAPDAAERHVGDLGNVVADENGVAAFDALDPLLELDGEHSILARSVVVHAEEDDFQTQPHGAAGKRVACGNIGLARK
jgi:Cu-Zn family superoxide dismutase